MLVGAGATTTATGSAAGSSGGGMPLTVERANAGACVERALTATRPCSARDGDGGGAAALFPWLSRSLSEVRAFDCERVLCKSCPWGPCSPCRGRGRVCISAAFCNSE